MTATRARKTTPTYYEDIYLPDPPSPDEVEFGARLDHVAVQFDLGHCRTPADLAWRLSHALVALERLALGDRKLAQFTASAAQRDRLCKAVVLAGQCADAKLPQSFDRRRLDLGMAAAYLLAHSMIEPRERRLCEHADLRQDVVDHMRRLRNALHDLNLEADIENRQRERDRVAAIAYFLSGAAPAGEA